MTRGLPGYRLLPDPWRGRIGLRRARRWLQAVDLARRHNRRTGTHAPTVNFYPMRPGPNSSIAHILARLEARIGHAPGSGALDFAWDTGTWLAPGAQRRLPAGAVNRHCVDISKGTVDRLWAAVAGYSISIDPLTTTGPLVEKPEVNGQHGGRVLEGPLRARRPGMVYQRLIDSQTDDGRIMQLRAVILGGGIVLVYGKWRRYPNWFRGTELTLPGTAGEYLSAAEQRQLLDFAAAIGLDYGEVDILRERESGRIFVVDANRTPVRPKGLPLEKEDESFAPQAEVLARLIGR